MAVSRDIPSPLKRQLRQEAGFGCCICGHPFIEYHHILQFSEVQCHSAADMMVLCPIHHHQCTVNSLTIAQQRSAKVNPFNRTKGFAEGQLFSPTAIIAVEAGTNQFIGSGVKFAVDNEPLLQLRSDGQGHLTLSLSLFDSNDTLLLLIENNEWISGDPDLWDIEYGYNTLVLRRAQREVSLTIDARSSPVHLSGELWRKGQSFALRPDLLSFNGVAKDVGFKHLGLVAQSLRADTQQGTFSIVPDTRLRGGVIVSWPDPLERLAKGQQAYKDLLARANIGRNEPCPCTSGKKYKHCHGV